MKCKIYSNEDVGESLICKSKISIKLVKDGWGNIDVHSCSVSYESPTEHKISRIGENFFGEIEMKNYNLSDHSESPSITGMNTSIKYWGDPQKGEFNPKTYLIYDKYTMWNIWYYGNEDKNIILNRIIKFLSENNEGDLLRHYRYNETGLLLDDFKNVQLVYGSGTNN